MAFYQSYEAGGPSGSDDSNSSKIDKPCNNDQSHDLDKSDSDSQSKFGQILGVTLLDYKSGPPRLSLTPMNNATKGNTTNIDFVTKGSALLWGSIGIVVSTAGMFASLPLGPGGAFLAYTSAMGFTSSFGMIAVALTGNNEQINQYDAASSLFSVSGIPALTVARLSGLSNDNTALFVDSIVNLENLASPSPDHSNKIIGLLDKINGMKNEYNTFENATRISCKIRKSKLP